MTSRQLNSLAVREAIELGHSELDPEHFVLAILHPEADPSRAREALSACGLTYASFRHQLEELPASYLRRDREVPERGLFSSLTEMKIRARAEGLALGLASPRARSENLLLAIIWEEPPSMVNHILDRLGATRERIRAELEVLGVDTPNLPFRPQRQWEEWREVSREELDCLGAELRSAGLLYRVTYKDDGALVSVEKAPT